MNRNRLIGKYRKRLAGLSKVLRGRFSSNRDLLRMVSKYEKLEKEMEIQMAYREHERS